eukprot:3430511-Amphidinium_carterae.1
MEYMKHLGVWSLFRLPEEDPYSVQEGVCGLLVTALNGVRDAAQSFERTINETLTQNGFKQG